MHVDSFIFKIASRCNLNCSYCYVYNKGNDSWKNDEKIMSLKVLKEATKQIKNYVVKNKLDTIIITFHGGEPTLVGAKYMEDICNLILNTLSKVTKVNFQIQTNGTLVDDNWISCYKKFDFNIGISIDGNKNIHDKERTFFSGKGSYEIIQNNINLLKKENISHSILCVIPLGNNSVNVHKALIKFDPISVNYIFPDFIFSERNFIEEKYGSTPLADYLIPLIDYWWESDVISSGIPLFEELAKLILGGESSMDIFGNHPLSFVFFTSSGNMESLDVLKICNIGYEQSNLNVATKGIEDFLKSNDFLKAIYLGEVLLDEKCNSCHEQSTCNGGYVPHRYSKDGLFKNPSVWCKDILLIFEYLRKLLNVSPVQTKERKKILTKIL